MKIRNVLLIIFFSFLLNCKKNVSYQTESFFEKSDKQINKVVLTGKTDDITVLEYLNIATETNLTLNQSKTHKVEKEIIGDSLHLVLNSIEKPLFAIVQASGSKSSFYRRWIFLIP